MLQIDAFSLGSLMKEKLKNTYLEFIWNINLYIKLWMSLLISLICLMLKSILFKAQTFKLLPFAWLILKYISAFVSSQDAHQ